MHASFWTNLNENQYKYGYKEMDIRSKFKIFANLLFGMLIISKSAYSLSNVEVGDNVGGYYTVTIDENRPITRDMTTFEINGLSLSESHYLPFIGNFVFQYPENVEWGFYPFNISKKAQICAEFSYRELLLKASSQWTLLRNLVGNYGVSRRFLFWVNDYTNAAPTRVERFNGFWFWEGGAGPSSGYWVWETTYAQDGRCFFPDGNSVDNVVLSVFSSLGF